MTKPNLASLIHTLLPLAAGSVLLVASVAYGQDGDSLDDSSLTAMQRGANALQAEDFAGAREAFTEAIATSPTDPRGYIGRGQALVGLEQQQEALADFKTAMDYTNSTSAEAKLLRAETQFQRGRMYLDMGNQFIGTALPDLQAAYEANRGDLRYSYALGKAYAIASPFNAGVGEQAEPLLTEYIEQNPEDAEAYRLRGTAYASMNKVDEAFADLNRAIELDPSDYQSYMAAATVNMTQDDYQAAAEMLQKAIENYEPEDEDDTRPFAQGYLTLAAVYEELGKTSDDPEVQTQAYKDSIATCEKLLTLVDDEPANAATRAATFFRKGIGHRLLGEYGEAVNALSKAIELNPTMGDAYFRRAICFIEMGEERLGIRDLKDAQALNFADARPYLWEGIAYAETGDYRSAIRAYNQAISFSNRYADAYLNRAHAYFQLGEYENAIDSFNECIRLNPEVADYYYKRGLCYHNLDELESAVKSYINAIEFDDDYAPAYDNLIDALEKQGRGDLASQYRSKRASLRQ